MLIRLYLLLAAFLTLGVDPPDDPDPNPDPPDDPDNPDLPDLEGGADPDPDHVDPDDPDAIREQLKAERTAREAAERNAREAQDRAAAAERARANPPAQSEEDKLYAQEEEILRNPQSTEQQKYWAQANRTLRENARTSRQALHESREIGDKADWERLKTSNPVLKRYEERVEKKLQEIRAGGSNLPRKVVAELLIGGDIVSGKVKSTKRATADAPAQTRTVDRGRAPSGRSDVRARGASSEQDKRRARLANQII